MTACTPQARVLYGSRFGDRLVTSPNATVQTGTSPTVIHAYIAHIKRLDVFAARFDVINKDWVYPYQVVSGGKTHRFESSKTASGEQCFRHQCAIHEKGIILLSKSDVEKAAETGFDFKLIAKKATVQGSIPAPLFKSVLNSVYPKPPVERD
jgi:hypothetical protein